MTEEVPKHFPIQAVKGFSKVIFICSALSPHAGCRGIFKKMCLEYCDTKIISVPRFSSKAGSLKQPATLASGESSTPVDDHTAATTTIRRTMRSSHCALYWQLLPWVEMKRVTCQKIFDPPVQTRSPEISGPHLHLHLPQHLHHLHLRLCGHWPVRLLQRADTQRETWQNEFRSKPTNTQPQPITATTV